MLSILRQMLNKSETIVALRSNSNFLWWVKLFASCRERQRASRQVSDRCWWSTGRWHWSLESIVMRDTFLATHTCIYSSPFFVFMFVYMSVSPSVLHLSGGVHTRIRVTNSPLARTTASVDLSVPYWKFSSISF